ncbi:MAG TPA: ABC transporter substrate-binding protein [Acholeplasmataceae bacterium]|nr:ABC transporter substrate-binding protein [Acholeplasmataceae bacterium]
MKSIKLMLSFLLVIVSGLFLSACGSKYKIRLAEVTHSVFYAPQYVALELGYFEEEGLDVTLVLTSGADKTMAALLSRDAQIGLMGPEASIFVYNGGQKNYAINFIQLTQCDGSFLVAREKIDNWDWDMVKGKEIIGGRKGGVPEMTLEYVLKQKGYDVGQNDPTKEVNVRTDIDFAAQGGAFVSGEGDFVTMFEPAALQLEKDGHGYVVASIGKEAPGIPFTAYSTTKEYMEKNPDVIQKFTNAIYRAQIWVQNHSAREIAEVIHPHFRETSLDDLEIVMQRYRDIDAWKVDPTFPESALNKLMEVMELANELEKRAPYDKIVTNKFANEAMKNIGK